MITEASILVGHPDLPDYKFSPEGVVVSFKYGKPRLHAIQRRPDGYESFMTSHGPKRKRLSVHRVIAELFCPRPDGATQVNHKDFNPANNHYTNLEWVTPLQNIRHSSSNGRRMGRPKSISEEFVNTLKDFHSSSPSIAHTARYFKICHATATYLLKGVRK